LLNLKKNITSKYDEYSSIISFSVYLSDTFQIAPITNNIKPMIFEDGINIIDDCEIRDTYEFKSDGNFIGVYNYNNGIDCEIDEIEREYWGLTVNKLITDNNIVILYTINKDKFELTEEGKTLVFERI
jgi:hypothetical protein